MIRRTALTLVFVLAVLLPGLAAAAADFPAKPNIIFILTDDQGYGDVGAHGNSLIRTPNLDKLHAQSLRFTDFQVSPTCAPTRSALMSGRHEFRNGITHTILERERLRPDTVTIAQTLKSAGYTTGIFGKWHLGDEAEYRPERRGFDEVFIHGAGGIGQTYPGSCGDAPQNKYFNPAIYHNGQFVKTTGYCTDVFFAQATKWMDAVKGRQPFLAWIATNAPHGPLDVAKNYEDIYAGKVPEDTAKYWGMITNIDENLGRLMQQLDAWGIAQNTLLVFMNDNGGTNGVKVFNAGMRGNKGTPYQGGVRAISFWRWPGVITPGDCDRLTAHVDVFRTWATLAGATLSPEAQKQAEGRDLTVLLKNPQAPWEDRTLVTHVGRWPKGSDPNQAKFSKAAIRDSRFKLVSNAGGAAPVWQLFDLKNDPGETTDVAASHPQVKQRLAAAYDQWWASVQKDLVNEQAVGPRVNPFKELYWKQFGGTPQPGDILDKMPEPKKKQPAKQPKKKQNT